MTINVLVSSASYVLSDYLISSEGTTCLGIMKKLGKYGFTFEAIAGHVDIRKPPRNIKLHGMCSIRASPSNNIFEKYLTHTEFIIKSYFKAVKILKKQKIDIIHHMFPAVYNQTFSLLPILTKHFDKPFIFGPASAHFTKRPLDERILNEITSKLHRKTISKCSHLITITEQVKKLYSKLFNEDKILVIPLGVDTEIFKPSKNRKNSKENFEILFAGSLYKLKGVSYLIKSLKQVVHEEKNVKLRIVGEGPEKNRLKLLAQSLGLKDHVLFEGFVPHDKIVRYYQNCDIFCFPTLGEPFGKAVIEAMSCGKPVIASNRGGPKEIVEDGKTGFLVPPGKIESLAEKILKLLRDKKLRRKMGKEARKRVLEKFSLEKVAESFRKLYLSLL